MKEEIKEYLNSYPTEIKDLYISLRTLIMNASSQQVEEKLWAKLPGYYIGQNFVRLIPFKDHINVEAKAVLHHEEELKGYKITPKGMIQVYLNQDIPTDLLDKIFKETMLG